MSEKPPLGLVPHAIWMERARKAVASSWAIWATKRREDIASAVERYLAAGKPVPPEWLEPHAVLERAYVPSIERPDERLQAAAKEVVLAWVAHQASSGVYIPDETLGGLAEGCLREALRQLTEVVGHG